MKNWGVPARMLLTQASRSLSLLMRLRAGRRLAPSAGGKPPGEPGWKPGAAGQEVAADASVSPHSPQVPPPGSHLRNRCLDCFRRAETRPGLSGQGAGAWSGRLDAARASLGPAPLGRRRAAADRAESSFLAAGACCTPGPPPKRP